MPQQTGINGYKGQDGAWFLECTKHGPIGMLPATEDPEHDKTEARRHAAMHLREMHEEEQHDTASDR